MPDHPTISVSMIVKNEEANLPRLLGSIQGFADEIIVVDTGSTDRTIEIAESYGAKVYPFEWCDDFSAARNESLKHATQDYILWLDGDDEIEKSEHSIIRNHLKTHFGTAVFLRIRNAHASEETKWMQLRAFPNHAGVRFEGHVHEQAILSIIEMGIKTTHCEGTIIHHGYESDEEAAEKLRRNRRIQEKELQEDPENPIPYFFLARTLKGLEEHGEALDNYLSFLDRAKGKPALMELDAYKIAMFEAGEMYVKLERMDDARAILEAGRRSFPGFGLFSYLLGQLHLQAGNYEKAYEEFLPLRSYRFDNGILPVDVKRSNGVVRRCLAISSLFTHDYATAMECLRESVVADPEDAENYHYLSLAYEKSGDLEKATEVCDEGLREADDDGFLEKRRFLLLIKKGDFEKALSWFPRLNGRGKDVDVLSALFLIYCRTLNMGEITRYYGLIEEALSLPPEPFPEGLQQVQEALASSGEPEAAEFFEGAIRRLLNN